MPLKLEPAIPTVPYLGFILLTICLGNCSISLKQFSLSRGWVYLEVQPWEAELNMALVGVLEGYYAKAHGHCQE